MAGSSEILLDIFKNNITGWSIQGFPDITEDEVTAISGGMGLNIDTFKKYAYILKGVDGEEVLVLFTNESITNSDDRSMAQIRFISENAVIAYRYAKIKKIRFFLFSIYTKGKGQFSFFNNIEPDEYIISIETNLDTCGTRPDLTSLYQCLNAKGNVDFIRIPRDEHKSGVEQASFIRISNGGVVNSSELEKYLTYFDNRPYMMSVKKGEKIVYQPSKLFEKGDNIEKEYPRNLLIFGAPGTGKSYLIDEKIKLLEDENGKENILFDRITFFEDYSYYQFVGSYKPVPVKDMEEKISIDNSGNAIEGKIVGEHVSYRFVAGPFARILSKAIISKLKGESKKFILAIEELNRANAASVFGDIFQLLDREDGVSRYEIEISKSFAEYLYNEVISNANESTEDIKDINIETFNKIRLPENLYIWATMNSADQGVFPLDTAFKRRWSFLYKDIDDISKENANLPIISLPRYDTDKNIMCVEKYDWNSLRTAINSKIIDAGFEEDRCIGYWFLNKEEMENISLYSECSVNAYNGNEDARIKLDQISTPLLDKLLSYLKQDVFRNMPTHMFHEDFKSLSTIRFALKQFEVKDIKNITLKDILKLKDNAFNIVEINQAE